MKKFLVVFSLVTLVAVGQIGLRSLRGPAVWVRDGGTGNDILVDLDPKTLVLDPPTTTGGRPILRVLSQTGPTLSIRQRATAFVYNGQPFALPETPLPGTIVRLMWGGLDQPGASYNVVGNVVTLTGTGWAIGDSVMVQYFY